MVAVDFAAGPPCEVVIAGDSQAEDTKTMLQTLRSEFLPNKIVLLRPSEQQFPAIDRISGFTESYGSPEGKARAYICRDRNCQLPTSDIAKMLEMLNDW